MTKKLDILLYAGLFSGLGVFSYLLLVSYSGFSPLVQEELYSFVSISLADDKIKQSNN